MSQNPTNTSKQPQHGIPEGTLQDFDAKKHAAIDFKKNNPFSNAPSPISSTTSSRRSSFDFDEPLSNAPSRRNSTLEEDELDEIPLEDPHDRAMDLLVDNYSQILSEETEKAKSDTLMALHAKFQAKLRSKKMSRCAWRPLRDTRTLGCPNFPVTGSTFCKAHKLRMRHRAAQADAKLVEAEQLRRTTNRAVQRNNRSETVSRARANEAPPREQQPQSTNVPKRPIDISDDEEPDVGMDIDYPEDPAILSNVEAMNRMIDDPNGKMMLSNLNNLHISGNATK
jgi:hypothetical protein